MNLNVTKLICKEPFSDLYPVKDSIKKAIKADMVKCGFNDGYPIHVWKTGGEYVVIDGHTRLSCAKELDIDSVPVHVLEFETEMLALEYAIKSQRDRRNLTKEELTAYQVRAVEALDKRKSKGGDRGNQYTGGKAPIGALPKSSEETADVVGISARQVDRVRKVLDSEESEIIEDLKEGKITINAASDKVKEKKAAMATFNKTNDNIEWAQWSWNPVTGCKFGCTYCYAADIANRFFSQGFEPTFYEDRLMAPASTSPSEGIGGKNVFVCSMADLFGDWVTQDWIDKIMEQVTINPQWNFLFLSKNPKRLPTITWPDNAWVGTTVDCQKRVEPAEKYMAKVKAKVKFISVEPFLEEIVFNDLSMINWLIIGGKSKNSAEPEFQPQWKWVLKLYMQAVKARCKVYWKPNLTVRPRDYPE